MKYYTLVIKTYNDGTDDKTSLYTYDNLDEAMATAHTQFGQNVGASTISSIMCTVINSVGGQFPAHTLYWTLPTYTVTFDANGGSGSMDAQTFTSGVAQALTTNAFVKDGYTFVGWSTDASATEATYTDGEEITVTADMTLYAVWSN